MEVMSLFFSFIQFTTLTLATNDKNNSAYLVQLQLHLSVAERKTMLLWVSQSETFLLNWSLNFIVKNVITIAIQGPLDGFKCTVNW